MQQFHFPLCPSSIYQPTILTVQFCILPYPGSSIACLHLSYLIFAGIGLRAMSLISHSHGTLLIFAFPTIPTNTFTEFLHVRLTNHICLTSHNHGTLWISFSPVTPQRDSDASSPSSRGPPRSMVCRDRAAGIAR